MRNRVLRGARLEQKHARGTEEYVRIVQQKFSDPGAILMPKSVQRVLRDMR